MKTVEVVEVVILTGEQIGDDALLQSVSDEKASKWQSRLEDFQSRDWTRHDFADDWRDLRNSIEQIDEIITELQDELDAMEEKLDWSETVSGGRPVVAAVRDALGDQYNGVVGRPIGDTGLAQGSEDETRLFFKLWQKERRIKEWQVYQRTLYKLAAYALYNVASSWKRTHTDLSDVKEELREEMDKEKNRVMMKVMEWFQDKGVNMAELQQLANEYEEELDADEEDDSVTFDEVKERDK